MPIKASYLPNQGNRWRAYLSVTPAQGEPSLEAILRGFRDLLDARPPTHRLEARAFIAPECLKPGRETSRRVQLTLICEQD